MRSSIILSLAALVGLAAAIPQPQAELSDTDIYTPASKNDAFPSSNLTRRGDHGDDYCEECPPEPCDHKRWKGCLYVECNDCDCDDDDCCSCIGLDKGKPYFLYYDENPPSSSTNNIQVSPTLPEHDFWYDSYDYNFYIDESSNYGIYFDQSPNYQYGEFTIGLSTSYTLASFYPETGLVNVGSKYPYDCDHYWVCKDSSDILRVYYQEDKPYHDNCCPVKLYFTNKEGHYDSGYNGGYDGDCDGDCDGGYDGDYDGGYDGGCEDGCDGGYNGTYHGGYP